MSALSKKKMQSKASNKHHRGEARCIIVTTPLVCRTGIVVIVFVARCRHSQGSIDKSYITTRGKNRYGFRFKVFRLPELCVDGDMSALSRKIILQSKASKATCIIITRLACRTGSNRNCCSMSVFSGEYDKSHITTRGKNKYGFRFTVVRLS